MEGKRYLNLTNLLIGTLILILLLTIFKLNKWYKNQNENQEAIIAQQIELIESNRMKGLMSVMSQLLDRIELELDENSERKLSDGTIERIADISRTLLPKSFNYVQKDSLADKDLSPERGQLLLTLLRLNMDSVSLRKIKLTTSFAQADLEGANLQGVDLSCANLMNARLMNADLRGANLDTADLKGANLWGANLEGASMNLISLNRGDLRWANLDQAQLKGAILKGIRLKGTKFRESDLAEAIIHYAFLQESSFRGANLNAADLFGSDLHKTNLIGANLSEADFSEANLSETDLNEANLSGTKFRNTGVSEENWITLLNSRYVINAEEIQELYKIEEDLSGKFEYKIVKIEN